MALVRDRARQWTFAETPSVWLQYALIYLMLLVPGSSFALLYGGRLFYGGVLAAFFLLTVMVRSYRASYGPCFILVLLAITVVVRTLVGGVGVDAWMEFAACIAVTQMAIVVDYRGFLDRWTRSVVYMAGVSVAFWALFCLRPELANTVLGKSYLISVSGPEGWETYSYGRGLFVYSLIDIHSTRNTGIYTEPGKYQVVLNSALLVLLFLSKGLTSFDRTQRRASVIVVLVALAACQSTTGFIAAGLIIFFYLLDVRGEGAGKGERSWLMLISGVILVSLIVDYFARGPDSVAYTQIFQKLFGRGSGLDFSEGTGVYRAEMIRVGLDSIRSNPFGVGYDRLFSLAGAYGEGLVAASLVSYGAVYGVVSWLIVMYMIFYSPLRVLRGWLFLLYLLLFVNTTLAQTHLLYPGLLLLPTYLSIGVGWPLDYPIKDSRRSDEPHACSGARYQTVFLREVLSPAGSHCSAV